MTVKGRVADGTGCQPRLILPVLSTLPPVFRKRSGARAILTVLLQFSLLFIPRSPRSDECSFFLALSP